MLFSEIAGLDEIKHDIIRTIKEDHMAHATILVEQDGCGALPLAIAIAQYMSCENRGEEDSCGHCRSCIKFNKLAHPDLHFSFPVNTTKSSDRKPVSEMFMEQWRELFGKDIYFTEQDFYNSIGIDNKSGNISVNEAQNIMSALAYKSYESDYKFLIMWLPERMNQEASNKLLKLVEEPPAGTIFLFVSQNPDKIISTILSRCRIIRIPPIDTPALTAEIRKRTSLNEEQALEFANASFGSVTRFKELLAEDSSRSEYGILFKRMIEACATNRMSEMILIAEEVNNYKKEELKRFLQYLADKTRSIMMTRIGAGEIAYNVGGDKDTVDTAAKYCSDSFCSKILPSISEATNLIERNVSSKLVLVDLYNRFFVYFRK